MRPCGGSEGSGGLDLSNRGGESNGGSKMVKGEARER